MPGQEGWPPYKNIVQEKESLQNGNSAATPLFTLKQDFKQPLCGKPVQFRCEWE